MPADTVLLVDEFHELFFDQAAEIVKGKLISVILKLKAAAQLVGVSATFRGEAGVDKINAILEAQFFKTPVEISEKKLHLEVFGKVYDIPTQAAKLALE